MFDETKNLNIKTCSDTELLALVRQTLPVAMVFVAASERLLKDKYRIKLCESCNDVNTCKSPCERLERGLPQFHQGHRSRTRSYGNLINQISGTTPDESNRGGNFRNYKSTYLSEIDRIRSDDIFILYKNCIHLFSKKEWRVITLRVEKGLTFKEIGLVLGIKTSTASDTFYRAQNQMEQHYLKNKAVNTRKKP